MHPCARHLRIRTPKNAQNRNHQQWQAAEKTTTRQQMREAKEIISQKNREPKLPKRLHIERWAISDFVHLCSRQHPDPSIICNGPNDRAICGVATWKKHVFLSFRSCQIVRMISDLTPLTMRSAAVSSHHLRSSPDMLILGATWFVGIHCIWVI